MGGGLILGAILQYMVSAYFSCLIISQTHHLSTTPLIPMHMYMYMYSPHPVFHTLGNINLGPRPSSCIWRPAMLHFAWLPSESGKPGTEARKCVPLWIALRGHEYRPMHTCMCCYLSQGATASTLQPPYNSQVHVLNYTYMYNSRK